jgi:SAM-dependent methyltransferase
VSLESFTLLDAACATGYYSVVIPQLDNRAINYAGCDYSSAMISQARAIYPAGSFSVQDLTELRERDSSFDVVLLAGVLEHIPDFRMAIAEACRVAGNYVIVHRCPVTNAPSNRHTVGSQYNIETARTWFSRTPLLSMFAEHGFTMTAEIPTYGPQPPRRKFRRLIAAIQERFASMRHRAVRHQVDVVTFVFRQQASQTELSSPISA